MRFWRLYRQGYDPLSGKGAEVYPGRWNIESQPTLYLGATASLTVLEVLVHAPQIQNAPGFLLAELEIDARSLESYDGNELPDGRAGVPAGRASREFGAQVFLDGALGFRVSSVVVPSEQIAVINAAHPEFDARVALIRKGIPYPFDSRLFAPE